MSTTYKGIHEAENQQEDQYKAEKDSTVGQERTALYEWIGEYRVNTQRVQYLASGL